MAYTKKAEKAEAKLKVLVDGKVSDGAGGYYSKGDPIEPVDADGLKAKGLVG